MTSTVPSTITPYANGIDHSADVGDALRHVVDQITCNGKADTAFGTARVVGQRTLIPVARVMYGFGGGSGAERAQQQGGGAGGGVAVHPFALIDVTSDKVCVVPVVDVQSMMARVFAFAVAAMLMTALIRRPRAGRPGSHVKIGRIEPHLSVTSRPNFRFHGRPPSRFAIRRPFLGRKLGLPKGR